MAIPFVFWRHVYLGTHHELGAHVRAACTTTAIAAQRELERLPNLALLLAHGTEISHLVVGSKGRKQQKPVKSREARSRSISTLGAYSP